MARILVVDDEVRVRELLCRALDMKGYEAVTVPDAEQALELIYKEPFDLILLDIRLVRESGLSVLKEIRERQSKVPVVVYSGAMTEEMQKEARLAGANEVLSKDIDVMQLVERLEKIVKAKEHFFKQPEKLKEKWILVVDDEEVVRDVLSKFFKARGYSALEADSGEKAIQAVSSGNCSLVLLDIRMPEMNGLSTLEKILAINPKLAVVMITAVQDQEKVKRAMELGAHNYVLKPFDFLYLDLVVTSALAVAESS